MQLYDIHCRFYNTRVTACSAWYRYGTLSQRKANDATVALPRGDSRLLLPGDAPWLPGDEPWLLGDAPWLPGDITDLSRDGDAQPDNADDGNVILVDDAGELRGSATSGDVTSDDAQSAGVMTPCDASTCRNT